MKLCGMFGYLLLLVAVSGCSDGKPVGSDVCLAGSDGSVINVQVDNVVSWVVVSQVVAVALVVIIFIVVIFVLWNRRLQAEVDERKRVEKTLLSSQQRLELAIKGGELGFWDVDLKTGVSVYNERWAEMLGYKLSEIPHTREMYISSICEEDRENVLQAGKDCREGRCKSFQVEYRAMTKQGEIRWMASKGAIVEWDDSGDAHRIVGMVADITERKHAERMKAIQLTQDVTVQAMASLAETRDPETGLHIRRTQKYVRILAEKLANNPKFSSQLDDASVLLIHKSAPLHDIGKVGIPDAVLLKPGKLTDSVFDIMKKHSIYGYDALLQAEESLSDQTSTSFLQTARDIARSHHEKWNGAGYPDGLKGNDIPISARLMAVADVYDALVSKRVYKTAFSHEKAVAIISEERGIHFDPDIVDAFLELKDEFRAIAIKYADGGSGENAKR